MKRLRFVLTFFFFIIPLQLLQAQETTPGSSTPDVIEYLVTADTANVRSGAGTSFAVAGSVTKGESLFIYEEDPEVVGWLRIYRPEEEDAYIADFLVERAPQRFYPSNQEPIFTANGTGSNITDVFDIPEGVYRVDISVDDNFFILRYVTVAGDCRDEGIAVNEGNSRANRLDISTIFVSAGCSIIFETDNVDRNWEFSFRSLIDPEVLDTFLEIEDGTTITGNGHQLTMGTLLAEGIWTVAAQVSDNFFILHAYSNVSDCEGIVFNEGDTSVSSLDVSSILRVPNDCIVWWETSNVDNDWEISFAKLR